MSNTVYLFPLLGNPHGAVYINSPLPPGPETVLETLRVYNDLLPKTADVRIFTNNDHVPSRIASYSFRAPGEYTITFRLPAASELHAVPEPPGQ